MTHRAIRAHDGTVQARAVKDLMTAKRQIWHDSRGRVRKLRRIVVNLRQTI